MNTETRVWSLIGVVIAVITMAVPVWVTYDIYGRGDLPEKQVELHKIGPINPEDLCEVEYLLNPQTFTSQRRM